MEEMARRMPNILITGTPGTGKTTMSQLLAEKTHLEYINVGELVKQHNLHSGRDEEYDCFVLDEDKVVDEMDERMSSQEGGIIVDFHTCDFFPERWFDLVIVLRSDNTTLYDRLVARGYSLKKVQENVECEIMQVVLEEAQSSYAPEIVQELYSVSIDDMESNVTRIMQWMEYWMQNNSK
ncbi:adenylate kinase [Thraustotheca clavata]|uniref:Adenylate kinase isoenzyme 6 homolog n=1 Tax=Thraustotheca clavata TaxID=74557 RepID=A0A1W0ABP5_9STRA|nr:adenylate kinase [Thraustotheca clavata]